MSDTTASDENAVTVVRRGHVLLIGLNRPEKRNAFNVALIDQLAAAYYELEHDEEIRCGVLFAHGDHFTGGLDLAEVGPLVREARLDDLFSAPGRADPWRKDNVWSTPASYDLIVTSKSGVQTKVATWSSTGPHAAGLSASSDIAFGDIGSVEIRLTGSTKTLLRENL